MIKASHKRPHIVWLHLYKTSRIHRSIEWENRSVIGSWDGGRWEIWSWVIGFFLGWWNVLKLIVVVVAQFCEYVKSHWIVHLREGRILKQNKTHKRLLRCEQPYGEAHMMRDQDLPTATWLSLEANSSFPPFTQSQAFRWSYSLASSFDCSLMIDHEPEVPSLAT